MSLNNMSRITKLERFEMEIETQAVYLQSLHTLISSLQVLKEC